MYQWLRSSLPQLCFPMKQRTWHLDMRVQLLALPDLIHGWQISCPELHFSNRIINLEVMSLKSTLGRPRLLQRGVWEMSQVQQWRGCSPACFTHEQTVAQQLLGEAGKTPPPPHHSQHPPHPRADTSLHLPSFPPLQQGLPLGARRGELADATTVPD